MDDKTQELIEYARTWLGTPWIHNQCLKDCGVDCIRFTMDCYQHMGVYAGEYRAYNRTPRGNSLLEYLQDLDSTTQLDNHLIEAGNLLVFKIARVPHHVGIATSETTFIHACQRFGYVIEQPLGSWTRKIATQFRVAML